MNSMNPYPKHGAVIKKLRIKAGYQNGESFAFDHKISRTQYHRMEKGCNFTLSSLERILKAHKITGEEYFKMVDKK
jgi:hypothetical protein